MNALLEEALEAMQGDPCPEAHTSSHWKFCGVEKTVVARQGDQLVLQGFGFGTVSRSRSGPLHRVERLTYAGASAALRNYARIWKLTKTLTNDLRFGLTYDVWKSSMVLATLADHWEFQQLRPRTFALIGDGHGILGALIHRLLPDARLYFIDLPKILVFQIQTMAQAAPGVSQQLLSSRSPNPARVNFVFPADLERIADPIDCAINIASMQEMPAASIEEYFRFLRARSQADSRFYCVNRARKELMGGEVTEFARYPWSEQDHVWLDGPCPYYTHFLSFQTQPNGPRWLGVRVPFVNYFDGVMAHRLVRLSPR